MGIIFATIFKSLPAIYQCKFGQNQTTGPEDNIPKRSYASVDRICSQNKYIPLPSVGEYIEFINHFF